MKKTKLISLLLSVCMCMSLVLTACDALSLSKLKKDPVGQVFSSSEVTGEALLCKYPALRFISEVITDGSVSLCAEEKGEGAGNSLNVTAVIDGEGRQSSYTAAYKHGDFNIEAKAYFDKDSFALSVPALAKDTYGVKYSALEESLKNSELLNKLGISYEEIMEDAKELIDSLKDIAKTSEETEKYFEEIGERLEAELRKVETESAKEKITLGEKEIKAYAVSMKLSCENLKNIFAVISEAVKKYADTATAKTAMAKMNGYGDEEETSIDTMLGKVENFLANNEPAAVVKLYLNSKTTDVMKIDGTFSYKNDGADKNITAALTLGEIPADSGEITLEVNSEGEFKANASVKRTDTAEAFSRSFSISYDDEKDNEKDVNASFGISLDKTQRTFEIVGECNENKTTAGGAYSSGETALEITLNRLEATDEEIPEFEARLTFTKGVKPEAMPEYKDLLTMTSDEFNALSDEITDNLDSIGFWKLIFGGFDFGDGSDWNFKADGFDRDFGDGDFDWDFGDGDFDWDFGDGDFDWDFGDGDFDWDFGDGDEGSDSDSFYFDFDNNDGDNDDGDDGGDTFNDADYSIDLGEGVGGMIIRPEGF